MKTSFWTVYFKNLTTIFRADIIFISLILIVVATTPIGVSFLIWYNTKVPASLVSKDPVAYPHQYKQKVEYRYYADFYFEEIKGIKRIEIADSTHAHAKKGDVYLFARSHKLQTGFYNAVMIASVIQFSCAIIFIVALLCHFVSLLNTHFSVRNKPYDCY